MSTGPAGGPDRRAVVAAVVLAAVVASAAALAGLGARATYGARTSGDEPYYLLTADSLASDGDLDIADELAAEVYAPYHEIPVDPQTTPLPGGAHLSPHDPLLPLVLAPAMGVGGWVAAKGVLALLAGLTAALTAWLAIRRLRVRPGTAGWVTAGSFAGMPLAPYGTQVYPEVPAALAVLVVVAAVSTMASRRSAVAPGVAGPAVLAVAGVVVLPWLSVKYVPVAAVLAALAAWRLWRGGHRRVLGWSAAGLVLAGVTYLVAHQVVYGGWTVYAAGDHFVDSGELSVVGVDPDHVGRARRLVGRLVDRAFGIGVWHPAWLVAPAAVAWLVARRDQPDRWLVVAPLAVGWLVATFVALTMHGWWVPGRQVVVVLPLAALALCGLVDRHRAIAVAVAAGVVAGVVNWLWLAVEASTGARTLIVDFAETSAPPYRLLAVLAPDGLAGGMVADVVRAAWAVLLAATAVLAIRAARRYADPARATVSVDPSGGRAYRHTGPGRATVSVDPSGGPAYRHTDGEGVR